MNLDSPNLRSAEPLKPDYLAGAVLAGLSRPIPERQTPRFLGTLIGGFVSFGLLPIITWPGRFRAYVAYEQQQFWHLAEWIRLNIKHPDAPKLRDAADDLRFRGDLQLLSNLAVGFVAVIFFTQLQHFFRPFAELLLCTYQFPHRHWRQLSGTLPGKIFTTWTVGLSVAYLLHWVQVQRYAASVRNFTEKFNVIAASQGLAPVRPQMPGVGLRPMWIAGAIVLCGLGAFWAIPMMLAGAAHQRMTHVVSRVNRAATAHRLRAMLLALHPTTNWPVPVFLRRMCGNPKCRSPLAESARFCPRCGSRTVPPLHQVA